MVFLPPGLQKLPGFVLYLNPNPLCLSLENKQAHELRQKQAPLSSIKAEQGIPP